MTEASEPVTSEAPKPVAKVPVTPVNDTDRLREAAQRVDTHNKEYQEVHGGPPYPPTPIEAQLGDTHRQALGRIKEHNAEVDRGRVRR